MIFESSHWKVPLLRSATWLERLRVTERTSEQTLARAERELFIGFYAVRKLLDTFKVSQDTRQKKFNLSHYPCVKMVDYFNAHRIDENFDLSSAQTEERDLLFLCNQFIHSYVFVPRIGEDGALDGAYVSSDRERMGRLFFVELTQVLDAFRLVGHDYPHAKRMTRNRKSGQWEEIVGDATDRHASL